MFNRIATLNAIVLALGLLVLQVHCGGGGGHVATEAPFPPSYLGGFSLSNSGQSIPGYWKDGSWVGLPLGVAFDGKVSSLALSGSDVYVGGCLLNGGGTPNPCYWKNGTRIDLPPPDPSILVGVVNSMAIAGRDVFAAGSSYTSARYTLPGVWKNGAWAVLPTPDASGGGEAYCIQLSGNDVYVGGCSWDTPNSVSLPCYWKNGTWVGLPLRTPSQRACVKSLVVAGTDVYAAGVNGNPSAAGYWKNGTWIGLSAPPPMNPYSGSLGYLVAASGGDVYLAGCCTDFTRGTTENGGALVVPGCWKNGVWSAFATPSPNQNAYVDALTLVGTDVYAAGRWTTNFFPSPIIWKNGTYASPKLPQNFAWGGASALVVP